MKKNNKEVIIIIVAAVSVVLILILTKIGENIVQSKYSISKNDDNAVMSIYVGDRDIIEKYYSEFIDKTLFDKKAAYEMLDEKYRNRFSYDDYENKLKQLSESNYYEDRISEYRVDEEEDYKVYLVRTNMGNEYAFKEKSIMNYTVYMDLKDFK